MFFAVCKVSFEQSFISDASWVSSMASILQVAFLIVQISPFGGIGMLERLVRLFKVVNKGQ